MAEYNNPIEYIAELKEYIGTKHKERDGDKEEFLALVSDILEHEKVQEMKQYNHHSYTSCFQHSLHVAYYNYKICKMLGWDVRAGAKAGLLHDLFLYDWHEYKPKKGERLHGFEHPIKSLRNARTYFQLTPKEGDIIEKHMFPLTITPPKYKESYVIVLTDKFCSTCEVFDRFFKKNHAKNRQRLLGYEKQRHSEEIGVQTKRRNYIKLNQQTDRHFQTGRN